MGFIYHYPQHTDGSFCATPEEIRAWEAQEIREHTERGLILMELAGKALADHILRRYPNSNEVLILCGQGNNGGDGFAAAWYLSRCGISVHLFVFDEAVSRTPEARAMFERVRSLPLFILKTAADAGRLLEWKHRTNLAVIDAIYGTGYRPTHNALMTRICLCIAELNVPVISADIPSGIDALTGFRTDRNDETPPRAIHATETVTFSLPKTGLLCGDGPEHTGELFCVDIGLVCHLPKTGKRLILTDEYCSTHFENQTSRACSIHKGSCGRIAVIGGDRSMPGAACLCARAALRSGCGLVTVGARVPMRTADEIMVSPILNQDGSPDADAISQIIQKADCIAVGPGLGRDHTAIEILEQLQDYTGRLIIDADALWSLSKHNYAFRAQECILTPHPGEAAMLCGCSTKAILFAPWESAQTIAQMYQSAVILKTHAPWITSKTCTKLGVCPYPNPDIVSAGIGDVLTGVTAAILAQARCGAWSHWFDTFECACIAVSRHSRAGRKAVHERASAACAGDIINCL